jgi:hypothetical protein
MPNKCKDSGSLGNKLTIRTEASPCSITAGGGVLSHSVDISNNRISSIYNVEIYSYTLRSKLEFSPSPSANTPIDWYHIEPVISPVSSTNAQFSTSSQLSAPAKSEGGDEVWTRMELFDESQINYGASTPQSLLFVGGKEQLQKPIIYGIDVVP